MRIAFAMSERLSPLSYPKTHRLKMSGKDTGIRAICKEVKVSPNTVYRLV